METSSRRRLAGSHAGQSRYRISPSPSSRIKRLESRVCCGFEAASSSHRQGVRDSASKLAQLSHKDTFRPRTSSVPIKSSVHTAQFSLLSVSTCWPTCSDGGCIQGMIPPPFWCRGGLIARMETSMVATMLHRCYLTAPRPETARFGHDLLLFFSPPACAERTGLFWSMPLPSTPPGPHTMDRPSTSHLLVTSTLSSKVSHRPGIRGSSFSDVGYAGKSCLRLQRELHTPQTEARPFPSLPQSDCATVDVL